MKTNRARKHAVFEIPAATRDDQVRKILSSALARHVEGSVEAVTTMTERVSDTWERFRAEYEIAVQLKRKGRIRSTKKSDR